MAIQMACDARRRIHFVPRNERRTPDILSIYDVALLVAIRAGQISNGCEAFIPPEVGLDSAEKIAAKELVMRRNPLKLRRTVGHTAEGGPIIEEWLPREMVISADSHSALTSVYQ